MKPLVQEQWCQSSAAEQIVTYSFWGLGHYSAGRACGEDEIVSGGLMSALLEFVLSDWLCLDYMSGADQFFQEIAGCVQHKLQAPCTDSSKESPALGKGGLGN
ncbi:hypothetical protein SKAU_G00055700 [Synaphobranchus kaupii]|uniref:Uncharacterized protein n=1 Tax=Synaphobranchus kaupii TaxID=118154 RepID=A0A9Q1G5A5_SYNKA|nr:hypothetical protein SKAU_G00055700 [Synaphobranchus kaupii]